MVRKSKTALASSTKITVLPPSSVALAEIEKLVPRNMFQQLPFWANMKDAEQQSLTAETYQLMGHRRQYGMSEIYMGQHLAHIKQMLDNYKGGFSSYLKLFHFTRRTGYRYIEDYERILKLVTPTVLQTMLVTGFEVRGATRSRPLGEYTLAHKALEMSGERPPASTNDQAAIRYVNKLKAQKEALDSDPRSTAIVQKKVEAGKSAIEIKRDSYDFMLKQTFHLAKNAMRKLPPKQRETFSDTLIGYLLQLRGISTKTLSACAIPSTFERQVGRPRKEESDEDLAEA